MSSDYNRQRQAKNAYYAYQQGYTHAVRSCAFAPTSCAACRAAHGEVVAIESVMHGAADHSNGRCSFTFIRQAQPAPPAPEPTPTPKPTPPPPTVDVCRGIRDEIVALQQDRQQYQYLATQLAKMLQVAGPDTPRETIMDLTTRMFDAMKRVSMIDNTIARLRGELAICEAGGHI